MTSPAARTFRRHVFFVAGYDPMDVESHHRIFARELARFCSVWNVAAAAGPLEPTDTGAAWTAAAEGPGWRTDTRFEMLAWGDLVEADMGRSRWSHVKGTVRALLDMIRTGTVARYFRTSHRYGIFFTLTYLMLALFWIAALAIGDLAARHLAPHTGAGPAILLQLVVTLAVGLALMRWPGRSMRLKQSLDLAEFSVDFARGRHPDLDARIRAFADRVAKAEGGVEAEGVAEIIVAGHSLGAMHAVSLIAEALARHKDFGRAVKVSVLTLGSTTAKFALHPAGGRFREAAVQVHDAPHVGWTEFQARDDIVSFYKVDPVTLGPISDGDASRRPLVRRVAIEEMLSPATYRRLRLDVMRKHCQFFLANDQRAPYDFYAFVCAPVPFGTLVGDAKGPLAVFAEDGGLRASLAAPSPLPVDAASSGAEAPTPPSPTRDKSPS